MLRYTRRLNVCKQLSTGTVRPLLRAISATNLRLHSSTPHPTTSSISNQLLFTSTNHLKAKSLDDVHSYQLLQDLGFLTQSQAGITHWHPLGLKVLRKLENIIRNRMDQIGFEEFELSSISSKALWSQTGRWGNTELFKISNDENLCLAPTHEEEITKLIKDAQLNHKNLPVLTYQITRKYRYEKRPRMGLLRGREFVMKDAYSFDVDYPAAMKTYDNVNKAYLNIFKNDLKLPFEVAKADSGDIGGSMSHEWHFVNDKGEDLLYKCNSCGDVSNVEKASSYPDLDAEGFEFAKAANVKYLLTKDNETLVSCYYPTDREFNVSSLTEYIDDLDLKSLNLPLEEVLARFQSTDTDVILKKFIRVMDLRINDQTDLPDFPITMFQKNNFSMITDLSIVEPVEGEICIECEEGQLESMKAIEVGHTFYLGKKYSEAMSAKFVNKDNKPEIFDMGCYGIGVSRIIGAIAEITKDSEGFRWPSVISPYDFSLVVAPKVEESLVEKFKSNVNGLTFNHFENDKVLFGNKIRLAKMIGTPLVVILGKNWPLVEIEVRGKRWVDADTPEYKQLQEIKGEQWQWTTEIKGNVEKHYVHKDHFRDVVQSLLKNL
ncbi:hypothetical protein WICPIJ_003705 [Wickerhamomyces pijperi]|uniref:proline--tRNA ligase n=1 Tax=Wickerhamomyces pijperi TaxID=599730 RepID=A0A9P8TMT2_WICPI|nr:hypothetical protein WICPIJ_003705 [Wickerhamomyces pijperi]